MNSKQTIIYSFALKKEKNKTGNKNNKKNI